MLREGGKGGGGQVVELELVCRIDDDEEWIESALVVWAWRVRIGVEADVGDRAERGAVRDGDEAVVPQVVLSGSIDGVQDGPLLGISSRRVWIPHLFGTEDEDVVAPLPPLPPRVQCHSQRLYPRAKVSLPSHNPIFFPTRGDVRKFPEVPRPRHGRSASASAR